MALVSSACLVAPPARAADRVPRFEPDTAAPDAPPLDRETWRITTDGYEIVLRRLDADERRAFIRRTAATDVDPFATTGEDDAGFPTFFLLIGNRSDEPLAFQSDKVWLKTNHAQLHLPLGLDELGTTYRLSGRELPAAYERVAPALLTGSRMLAPGEEAVGLVVFRQVEPQTKSFRVEIDLVAGDGEVIRFAAPYRRAKDGRRKGGAAGAER